MTSLFVLNQNPHRMIELFRYVADNLENGNLVWNAGGIQGKQVPGSNEVHIWGDITLTAPELATWPRDLNTNNESKPT